MAIRALAAYTAYVHKKRADEALPISHNPLSKYAAG